MNEKWFPIPDSQGLYEFSNLLNVRSLPRIQKYNHGYFINQGRILKQHTSTHGYLYVATSINQTAKKWFIHRLVALLFIPNPENKPHVNHINGIKTDNRIQNLEWCTKRENEKHAAEHGLLKHGETSWLSKLTDEKIRTIRDLYKQGATQKKLADKFGVHQANIHHIIHRKTWKHVI